MKHASFTHLPPFQSHSNTYSHPQTHCTLATSNSPDMDTTPLSRYSTDWGDTKHSWYEGLASPDYTCTLHLPEPSTRSTHTRHTGLPHFPPCTHSPHTPDKPRPHRRNPDHTNRLPLRQTSLSLADSHRTPAAPPQP